MNLKDLFDSAENGMLTYDQLMALTQGKSKFVDLADGGYVDKKKYDDDIASRDTRITSLGDTIKSRDNDLANLQTQLKVAGTDAEKLSQLGTDFANLQQKYDDDTKAYAKQLQEQAYKYAVNDFANTQKFTSKAARRDFVNSMLSKNLTMEGDTIIGASDFVTAYAKENNDAFVVDTPSTPEQPKPHFVDTTTSTPNNGEDASPFQFNFTGVRPHEK